MKKLVYTITAALLIGGLSACTKDDNNSSTPYTCASCATAPEAKEIYNTSSAGVYKGVVVGSTGTIALYLYNTGTVVEVLVTFDGKSGTLTTTDLSGWTPGQPISNALFTGTINGTSVQAVFSVDADGKNPSVTLVIPGHTVTVAVYKETSAILIKNFEGTYSGDDNGIFNMAFSGDDYSIVSDGGGDPMEGKLVGGKISLSHDGVEISGSFSGADEISGTWKDTDNNKSGTWKGKRTL